MTNTGNMTTSYSVDLLGQQPPNGVTLQLTISRSYLTPVSSACALTVQSNFVAVANITNVSFATLTSLLQPAANNPTQSGLALLPGQSALITVRAFDFTTNNFAQALAHYNPGAPVQTTSGNRDSTTVNQNGQSVYLLTAKLLVTRRTLEPVGNDKIAPN